MPVYNVGASTLELRTYDEVYFMPQEVTMIRYGDSSKETNICNVTTSFKYMVKDGSDFTNVTTSMSVPLVNTEQPLNTLFATFTLLDDEGTVKVVYSRDGQAVADATVGIADDAKFAIKDNKLKITDFVKIDMNPFRYVVTTKAGEALYAGSSLMFFDPEHFFSATYDNF